MFSATGGTEPARPAPDWQVSAWLGLAPGQDEPDLARLRGRVIVLHAFQMLCPGCVSHGLPQAQRIANHFDPTQVAVIGLHSVFEHHKAMTPTALRAFVHEYRWTFPIGVDQHSNEGRIPLTMQAYAMQGTPTLILIDRDGLLRYHWFGRPADLEVGAAIATLVAAKPLPAGIAVSAGTKPPGCDRDGCAI